jgi:DNA recombination protein RmuC
MYRASGSPPLHPEADMLELLTYAVPILLLAAIVLLVLILLRGGRGSDLRRLEQSLAAAAAAQERLERVVREEIVRNRQESAGMARETRLELTASVSSLGEGLSGRVREISSLQQEQLESFAGRLVTLTGTLENRLDTVRETIEGRLRFLQQENSDKLEQMRATVDERLHSTLERRLGESFRLVSERLEEVQRGLGEMKDLAVGVGDLKKVLTNVKSRGTWGEFQLGSLLEQILTAEQYGKNVATRPGSAERVEYAIRLPGRETEGRANVWLPVDAKFPQEDYQRLVQAQDQANPVLVEEAARALEARVKTEARSIRDKYVEPPHTTDFAILFLPVEGLYAEVLRRPGLAELLQREFRVTVAGPTTLAALLNSLQMGFRTLAIEKRSSEVWNLLATVKNEFGKFGDLLDKTQKKLQEASSSIETAARSSRAIEKKLKDVQQLPAPGSSALLEDSGDGERAD